MTFSTFSSLVRKSIALGTCGVLAAAVSGCGSGVLATASSQAGASAVKITGVVHGGQQVVSQSVIQLYAVGSAGIGSSATPLLTSPVWTDNAGGFSLTGLYTCPSAATNIYLVAVGGNPGLSFGQNNSSIAMMSVLGHCGDLNNNSFVSVNEVTTVAAVYALAPYMHSYSTVGVTAGGAQLLDGAFSMAQELANSGTGVTPGPVVVSGHTVQVKKLQTLANILSACVNTAGGQAGDYTPCGSLFGDTTYAGVVPSDTISSLLHIALNPTQNVKSIFNINPSYGPFQPSLNSAPSDWSLGLTATPGTLSIISTSLPSSTAGAAYSAQLQAAGGTPSYTWTVTSGQLPSGLLLDSSTGIITGTTQSVGSSSFTVAVGDASHPAQSVSMPLSIISLTPLTITSSNLVSGTVGTAYAASLQAAGGAPSYTWSIASGTLPAGLTLAATTGVISGTPATSGVSNFTVAVRDSSLLTQTQTAATSITIVPAPAPVPAGPATWYVRPDGGTRYSARATDGQCDGKADVAYSGTGTNQHCAFNDYRYLWDDKSYGNSQWVISGGDTVILRGGPWRVGFNQGTNPNDAWCFGGNGPFACMNPTIPAGTDLQHTRILGENYASCGSPTATDRTKLTQVFGGFGVAAALNLKGAQYVDVQCIELSSHSECSQHGLYKGTTFPGGCSTAFPLTDFAQNGIFTDTNTHDLLLEDLWIHGFPTRGVIGPIGGLVTATRTALSYNGFTGWDFDDGNSTVSTNATWKGSFVTIEYSGCIQEYPIVHNVPIVACYDQSSGGQGDGIGTPPTALNFSCDHCDFHYNTQDGADFGHVSLSQGSFTNSIAYGNMGGTFKAGPNTNLVLTNNVSINNCQRMSEPLGDAPDTFRQALSNFCRASGDGISFNFPSGTNSTAVVEYNTIMGYGADMIDVQCQIPPGGAVADPATCPHSFTFKNNIVLGFTEASYNVGQTPSMWNTFAPTVQSNNTFWGLRTDPTTSADILTDPLFVGEPASPLTSEAVLDNFNFAVSSNSPAIGAGVVVLDVLKDYAGVTRSMTAPTIGALEHIAQ